MTNTKKKIAIIIAWLLMGTTAFAVPVSVNRLNNQSIEPSVITDFIKAPYFVASSTSTTSTFAGRVFIGTTTDNTYGTDRPQLNVQGTTSVHGYFLQGLPRKSTAAWIPNYIADFNADIEGYAGWTFNNKNTGSTASTDILFNNSSSTEVSYYADIGFSGGSNTDPLYTGLGGRNSLYMFNSDGQITMATPTTTSAGFFSWVTGGYLSNNEKMRLTNTGWLGIGTSTPLGQLHLVTGDSTKNYLDVYNNSNVSGFYFRRAKGTVASPTSVAVNDYLGEFPSFGYANNSFRLASDLTFQVDSVSGSTVSGNVGFFTTNAAGTFAERMRISGEGRIGIGTTTPISQLDILGNVVNSVSGFTSQLMVRGATSPSNHTNIGYNTTSNFGFIEAVNEGVAWRPLVLQPTSGNVGIGTNVPQTKLEVNNITRISGGINSSNVYPTTGAGFELGYATDLNSLIAAGAGTSLFQSYDRTGSAWKGLNVAALDLSFNTNGSSRMYISSSGLVGIGTTTPTTTIHITASGANATSTLTVGKVGQNKGTCLEYFDSAGSPVYFSILAGGTTFTGSTVSCK